MSLIERYITVEIRRLVMMIAGFLIFMFASYSAQRYLADHNGSPEVRRFADAVAAHLEGPLGMVLYEYCDGKIGPPSMEVCCVCLCVIVCVCV